MAERGPAKEALLRHPPPGVALYRYYAQRGIRFDPLYLRYVQRVGSVFIHSRVGTLYLFCERLQQFQNKKGQVYKDYNEIEKDNMWDMATKNGCEPSNGLAHPIPSSLEECTPDTYALGFFYVPPEKTSAAAMSSAYYGMMPGMQFTMPHPFFTPSTMVPGRMPSTFATSSSAMQPFQQVREPSGFFSSTQVGPLSAGSEDLPEGFLLPAGSVRVDIPQKGTTSSSALGGSTPAEVGNMMEVVPREPEERLTTGQATELMGLLRQVETIEPTSRPLSDLDVDAYEGDVYGDFSARISVGKFSTEMSFGPFRNLLGKIFAENQKAGRLQVSV